MKIAVVCDWLTVPGGAERVLSEILACYPGADLFAVLDFLPSAARDLLHHKPVRTTFLQHVPLARRYYRALLPLMPLAIEQLDLRGYDLVISASHAVAKGVLTGPGQLHVSYIHSPMRYAWDLQAHYLTENRQGWLQFPMRCLLHRLRLWDQLSAARPDCLIANSRFIARRIQKTWRRHATVIYPAVDTTPFQPCLQKQDFFVTASRLVPYKKVDLIVDSFSAMPDKKLVVIGDGPEAKKIRRRAGSNVHFAGFLSREAMADCLQQARAFIFAAEEDFGIVALEAQACTTPVIALGRGGARETIQGLDSDNPTGIFFEEQTVAALCAAVRQFESLEGQFTASAFSQQVAQFSPQIFREAFVQTVNAAFSSF